MAELLPKMLVEADWQPALVALVAAAARLSPHLAPAFSENIQVLSRPSLIPPLLHNVTPQAAFNPNHFSAKY